MEINKSGLTCYREEVTEARGGEEGRRAYLCYISHDLGQHDLLSRVCEALGCGHSISISIAPCSVFHSPWGD